MNTESSVTEKLYGLFANYYYKLKNVYIFENWECDFFCVSTSGYMVEVEVKVSRQDFIEDFKSKKNKHIIFKNNKEGKVYQTLNLGYCRGDEIVRFVSPFIKEIPTHRYTSISKYLRTYVERRQNIGEGRD